MMKYAKFRLCLMVTIIAIKLNIPTKKNMIQPSML